jgi:protein-S-isoprenylcysteine O-methyltransferase Ste14
MNPVTRLITMAAIWILWMIPFFLNRARGKGTAVKIDSRARPGIIVTAVGFLIANTHRPEVWGSSQEWWRVALGIALGLIASALAWMSVGNLGRQWRVDAGLNADHQLVQSGAYRVVRHPIYLSILCMLFMNVAMLGTLPGWPIAVLLGLVGTEIRVRVEDGLLRERFGPQFTEWQKRVSAYLPFLR